jgi:hypothetical protein
MLKVFACRQTNRWIDRPKTISPPAHHIFQYRGSAQKQAGKLYGLLLALKYVMVHQSIEI